MIRANASASLDDASRQNHHIVPLSLGGADSAENMVALLPKDHALAHELLFKHTAFCAVKMAHAVTSILGKKAAQAADLGDEYDFTITDAYNMARKRTVRSLRDMSKLRIGFFDLIPEGYVEPPKDGEKTRIYNAETGKTFAGWKGAPPEGWKTKSQLGPEELAAFAVSGRRGGASVYAYDVETLETGKFAPGRVPAGWAVVLSLNPASVMKQRLAFLDRLLKRRDVIDGVRSRWTDERNRIQAAVDGFADRPLAFRDVMLDSSLGGYFTVDGRTESLRRICAALGFPYETAFKRLYVYGWDIRKSTSRMSQSEVLAELGRSNGGAPLRRVAAAERTASAERAAAEKAETAARLERLLAAWLEEFNELGWRAFMEKHGEREGRRVFCRLKERFGKEALRLSGRDLSPKEIPYRGRVQSVTKWRKELGLSPWRIYRLVRGGATFQEAFDSLLAEGTGQAASGG